MPLQSFTRAASACALTLALASAASAADPAHISQAMLDAMVKTNGVPGMGAAIWQDGKVIWEGSSGYRDLEAKLAVDRNTVFRFASVSKVIATTAAAKLQEEGKLDWQAPVKNYLPWLKNDWPSMNLRQLSAHISGLPHYQVVDTQRGNAHYPTARDAVGIFSDRSLLHAPGEAYHYSSWGYTLIGAVIEAQSGQHFLDYLKQHITKDLRIQADSNGVGEQVSRLYAIEGGPKPVTKPHDFSYTWPGGGLAGTPESLARFGGRVLNGEIVSQKTFEAMQQAVLKNNGEPASERDFKVGFGWRVSTDPDGARLVHHNGVTEGARSALVLWPEKKTSAAMLSNALWIASIDKSAAMLSAAFLPAPKGLVAVECPVAHTRFEGQLADKPVNGKAVVRMENGLCVAELETEATLQAHFKSATAWPDKKMRLIGLDANGGLSRAALVTPFGLYDVRANAAQQLGANLTEKVRLQWRFVGDLP